MNEVQHTVALIIWFQIMLSSFALFIFEKRWITRLKELNCAGLDFLDKGHFFVIEEIKKTLFWFIYKPNEKDSDETRQLINRGRKLTIFYWAQLCIAFVIIIAFVAPD